jgi:hypothetical protein
MKILRYILVSAMLAIAGLAFGQQPTLMTRAIVTSNEIVGANAVPVTAFEVTSTATASPRGILSSQYTTDALGARLGFMKARGTRAVPLTIVSGDNLGRLNAWPYDGASYLEMGSIIFSAEGTVGTNRVPTNISFWTATDANPSVLTQRLVIDSAGNFTASNGAWWLNNAIGGMPGAGSINAKGFLIDGVPVGTSTSSYWNAGTGNINYLTNGISLTGNTATAAGSLRANQVISAAAHALDLAANGNVTINTTNGSTLAATFSGTSTALAGNLTVSGTGMALGTINTSVGFNLVPTGLVGTTQYGIAVTPTISSAATTSGYAGYFRLGTAAAAFTATTGYGIYIDSALKGAGSAITTSYGLYVGDQLAGGTNYAIYTVGSAPSVLGGNLTISGATASTSTTIGALVVSGGVGVAGALYTGGNIVGGGSITAQSGSTAFIVSTNNATALSLKSAASTVGLVLTNTDVLSFGAGGVYPSAYQFYTVGAKGLSVATNGDSTFSSTTAATAYNAASVTLAGGLGVAESIVLKTITAPAAPSASNAKLYVDVSGGKNRLMVIFPTGAAQQVAIEP